MVIRCKSHRFCEIGVMFCRLKLGPQDSLLSQVFLHSNTKCHFMERREGASYWGLFFEHLIKVDNCCYGRCYGKSLIVPIRDLKFYCFNAANRLRLFQDSISKCLKVTILRFRKVTFVTEHHRFEWKARKTVLVERLGPTLY